MNRIFGALLFISLLGVAWNILAALLSLVGIHLPGIDPGVDLGVTR